MSPQIEILLVPSATDPLQWVPVAASLAGFPWGSEERRLGIVANCPDVIEGVDVGALLAQLTDPDAPVQVQLPFQPDPTVAVVTAGRTGVQTQDTVSQVAVSRPSTVISWWSVDVSVIDESFLKDDPNKPVLPADAISTVLVTL